MSDHDQQHDRDQGVPRAGFRNEDTVQRRAWIDRALAGVRERLRPDELGSTGRQAPDAASRPAAPMPVVANEPDVPSGEPMGITGTGIPGPGRPRLTLVRKTGPD